MNTYKQETDHANGYFTWRIWFEDIPITWFQINLIHTWIALTPGVRYAEWFITTDTIGEEHGEPGDDDFWIDVTPVIVLVFSIWPTKEGGK